MDLHKILLYVLATLVALGVKLRLFFEQFLHFKDLFLHYVWLVLHKFLPKRRFVLEHLPKHVAFSIADYVRDENGASKINLSDLSRLIFWCGRYGVEKVSVYDWMGYVATLDSTRRLSDLVWTNITDQESGLDDLRLSINGHVYEKIDRDRNRENTSASSVVRTLDLVILDWKAGRRAIVEAARTLANDIKSGSIDRSKSLNGSDVRSTLQEYLTKRRGVSAPDLLFEIGGNRVGDSTCGYPPLALRVVEIVRIPKHVGIDELTFLECLEKYSQRDRRHGK